MKPNADRLTATLGGLLVASFVALPDLVQGQPTAHYPPGIEGIKGASLPPPGVYLRDYNYFYFSDRVNDRHGDKISAADPEAFIYANVPRVVWITEQKLLGGFLGVDALLPFQYTDLEVNTPGGPFDDSTFGIGDFFVEGTWSWHPKQFDLALGLGAWMPTGDSAPPPTTRAGQGFWTVMFTGGATWYPDEAKQWALSALTRYEVNSDKEKMDYTPGDAFTLEWGLSRALSKTVDVGAIGYYQQQVTGSSGSDRPTSGDRDRVAGVGPEISVAYPRYMLGWSLRYAYEFMAENRLQGHTVALTITKRF